MDRKELFNREGVLTSSTNVRSNHTSQQNMEKDKIEKSPFGQHFVNESGFRTIDLLKPSTKPSQGRNIVPASLSSTQLHGMPSLLPNYITGSGHLINPVPINHSSLIRGSIPAGQHAFQTHIPVGIGASPIAPPRGSISMSHRSSLPSLKPTNLSNQIQLPLNQIPGLPTILPPSVVNRTPTGSPIVTTHGLSSLDSRTTLLSDPHHGIRGNIQASSPHAQATIQVIASGTAAQQHIQTSFLSKGMNATSNMLKIGVSSHSSASSASSISASAFKLGIGKAYPSSVIMPATSSISRADLQEIRHNVIGNSAYSRFSTHNVTLPSHHMQSHAIMTTVAHGQTPNVIETRSHPVGVPYHPITGAAYVFHDMAVHSFPHHLIRPPTSSVSAVPMFTLDQQRGLPTVPIVSIAVSTKGNIQVTDSNNVSRTEGLTIHGTNSFPNLYPNLQPPAGFQQTFSTTSSTVESSIRPSILRKRHAETTSFPVQPTEKERISSPLKSDNGHINMSSLPNRLLSPPNLISHEMITDTSKPTNHSILSLTSDLKNSTSTTTITSTVVNSATSAKVTIPPVLLTNVLTNSVSTSNSLPEASPKKKPRKQLIITTEDKYGSTAPINSYATDEDEEFLKSNETMKDITPPKTTTLTQTSNSLSNSHLKQLFPYSPTTVKSEMKQEFKETHLNGMITTSTDTAHNKALKYMFRRRPQVSIVSEYKVNAKAAHNHFYRYSDIRVKEEKKSTLQERLINKTSLESASGWRLHHLSTQLDDMVSFENEICQEILQFKKSIPLPSQGSPTNFHSSPSLSGEDLQLRLLHELVQGNVQRCRYSAEQLEEVKQTMFKVLDHKPKAVDFMKKQKQKPRLKKKTAS